MPPSNPFLAKAVGQALEKLAVAFPAGRIAADPLQSVDVYCIGLDGVSLDAIDRAVDRAIRSERYFPKPAELRDYAFAVMREDESRRPAWVRREAMAASALLCASCGVERAYRRFERAAPLTGLFDKLTCRCDTEAMHHAGVRYLGDCDDIDPLPTDRTALLRELKRRLSALETESDQRSLGASGSQSSAPQPGEVRHDAA